MVPILPGKSHGQRSLEGCSPWGRWGSDTTERLPFHFSLSCIGEGKPTAYTDSCACIAGSLCCTAEINTWPASCVQVKRHQLEVDMEQQTGSKSGKEYTKAVYCHPADLTYMQSIQWETLGWMKHKLESRLLGEISVTSDMQMTHPYGRKRRRTKEPFDESESGEWRSWLKAQHSEN